MSSKQDEKKEYIIKILKEKGEINSEDLAKEMKKDHQQVVGLIKALESKEVVETEKKEVKKITLTDSGKNCLEKGSPDIQILKELKQNGTQTKKNLLNKLGKSVMGFGLNLAMKAKSVTYDKSSDNVTLVLQELPAKDEAQENLIKMSNDPNPEKYDNKLIQDYIKIYKYIKVSVMNSFLVKKGKNLDLGLVKLETELTADLLANDKWESAKFSKYNYSALGKEVPNGALHRLLCVRSQIREIFLEQGFEEMPTNNFVESSFWNFDSLFQPQQHPSREAHDTFFLSHPAKANSEKYHPEYFQRVKEIHEKGGFGSIGWKYDWSADEAEKNILRTHTTAVSSRMLYKLAQEYKQTGKFTPKKYFSIDRVFRNESLDNTHLAEFHQIEGFIADYDLGLGHLLGTVEQYFKRVGLEKLRFKPAYNPYTEPSMEIFALHPVTKKWIEIGNSGVFRPEMLLPMGLPQNVNVIAWGFSLERPAMIHYHLSNIRDLFGHEVNIKHTQEASMYYFKE